ncbi:MAG: ABC transporter substrate-binding protein [Spirochaetaceae bacterium]|jgi:ABC-type Fe3+ transport system substrate-binding protein|nr:ABC transporter substrate-binding protein [Spirochaetaceae bacterium]
MQKLKQGTPVRDEEREELDFLGGIYCPAKERFGAAFHDFEAAYNEGKSGTDRVRIAVPSEHRNNEKYHNIVSIRQKEKFPAIVTAAGFLEFFRTDFISQAESGCLRGWFASLDLPPSPHPLFQGLQLDDPKKIFTLYGAMPYVLVVNHRRLNGRAAPRRIDDLIKSEYSGSVAVPYAPDDITEHLLLSIWRKSGADGIQALARNVLPALTGHAPELISDMIANKDGGACVYLMTWFFANSAPKRDYIEVVWPEDGALLCPLYAVAKADLTAPQKAAADFLLGAELGQKLSEGWFAHINPDVRYKLDRESKPHFQWEGWDYIYEKPLEERVAEIERMFKQAGSC